MYYLSPYVRLIDSKFYWRRLNTSDKTDMLFYSLLLISIGIKLSYIVIDILKERSKKCV